LKTKVFKLSFAATLRRAQSVEPVNHDEKKEYDVALGISASTGIAAGL